MRKTMQLSTVLFCFFAIAVGTVPKERRSTPALELLNAVRLADAHASGQGFKIHATVKLGQERGAETKGDYLLVWASPTRWREELSFADFHQVRIGAPGGVWERRKPSYLPLRVWQLMQAVNYDGRLRLPREETANKIKRRRKKGFDLRCVSIERNSYRISELCFHEDTAQLVSEHYLPSDRWYEFADYRTIRTKYFPGHIVVRDGKTLAVDFSVSDVEETDSFPTTLFEKPAQARWSPWCASPEAGGDPLTPIYSGLAKHKGVTTLYGAVGTDGQWHDVHVLESGGASHDAEVLEALKKERWKPALCNAVPIVIETVFQR